MSVTPAWSGRSNLRDMELRKVPGRYLTTARRAASRSSGVKRSAPESVSDRSSTIAPKLASWRRSRPLLCRFPDRFGEETSLAGVDPGEREGRFEKLASKPPELRQSAHRPQEARCAAIDPAGACNDRSRRTPPRRAYGSFRIRTEPGAGRGGSPFSHGRARGLARSRRGRYGTESTPTLLQAALSRFARSGKSRDLRSQSAPRRRRARAGLGALASDLSVSRPHRFEFRIGDDLHTDGVC